MGELLQFPTRCDYSEEGPTPNSVHRCKSTNARFVPAYQGNLCMVHEASYTQARRRHPAGKKGNNDGQ